MGSTEKKGNPTGDKADRTIMDKIGALWTTHQMSGMRSREIEVQITLRELVLYLMFLILLLILSLGMTGSTLFFYTKVMTHLFVEPEFNFGWGTSFKTSTQLNDFWDFTEIGMINGLFWDAWYNRTTIDATNTAETNETPKMPIPTSEEDRKIMYHNKLVGLPRLRQLRVRSSSCIVHEYFRKSIKKCYDFYTRSGEDKNEFGKSGGDKSGTAWTYKTEEELEGSSHIGVVSRYGGGGFIQDLDLDKKKTQDIIQNLKKNLWLDRGTRAIFLDFTVYNGNINLFCIVKLVMEFPPTGGMIPSYSFRTVKLLRYVTPMDFFVLACEMVFVCFTIFYTLEEVREVFHFKTAYFKSQWNCLDTIIILISYFCIGFSVYRHTVVDAHLTKLIENDDHYEDFSDIGYWQIQYNNWVAICVFFSWIKVFKYISFNKTMSQLSNTLSRCARDVAGFAVMFFIVFCAFAQLGYLLFGTQVEAFSSFKESVFTLLRTILGDFDYEAIENANRILGPCFFILYIFFVFFVLLNMFLAIINDTYSEVKSEIAVRRNEFEVGDFFSRGVVNVKSAIGLGRNKQLALKDDSSINYRDVRALLLKCNFTELEIEMFFSKYDLNDDKILSSEELARMLRDLAEDDTKPARFFSKKSVITPAQFKAQDKRIQWMERTVIEVVERCNLIADILEGRSITKPLTRIDPDKPLDPEKKP